MKNVKYVYKTSYRINEHIKYIIDKMLRDACKQTHLELSNGKIARALWETLENNPSLRKRCMECVCEKILKDEAKNEYRKRPENGQGINREGVILPRKSRLSK